MINTSPRDKRVCTLQSPAITPFFIDVSKLGYAIIKNGNPTNGSKDDKQSAVKNRNYFLDL